MNGNDFSKYMNNAIQSGLQEIDNVNLNSLNKQSGINILDPNDINRYRFQKDFDASTFNPYNPYNEQNWINKESWGSALRKGFSGMASRFSNTFVDYWADYGRMVDALFSWDWSKMIKSPEEQYKAYYEDQQEMYKNYVFVPEEKRDAIFGKSGISEFISNAGFSLGTYTGFALELLADAAITIATLPAGGEGALLFGATLGKFGAILGKFGAKLGMKSAAKATAKSAAKATAKSAATKTTKASQFFKGMYQYSHIDDFAKAVSSPNNFTRAQRNMVKDRFAALSFNIGGIAKSKSVGDFFLQVGKGLPYLGEAFRYGERMVKAGKAGYSGATLAGMGVMGLRRMAQEFNMASTQASFEAIQSYGTSLDMMLQDYKNKGYNIDEYDFNKMQELSFESSLKTYNTNLAILGLTNRIQFGTLFNKMPMHKTWLTRNIMGNSLEGIHTVSRKGVSKIYNTSGLFGGTRTLFKIGKDFGWRKAGIESIKLFGKDFLKFDLVEGLQEIMQETTSKAWADYYSNQYYNAEKSIGTAFGDALGSMWSKEGLKIFVHGAMAGGMIKIPTHVMNNVLEYTQIKTTDRQYGKKENPYRQARKRKQEDIDFLNDLMWTKDFNSSSISGLANALQNSIKMDEAAKNGNDYEWNNAKDNMLIQGIVAANRLGVDYAYIHAVETLGDDITIEEFNKMMGVDLDQTKYSTPKEFTSKIASQLRRYTDTVTKLRNEFKNKINPADFDPKSSNYIAAIITAKKQEEAINNIAILELQGERNLERIQKMKDEVSKLSGLETSSYYAFEILTNRERLNSELGELEGRILTLKNTLKAEGLTKDDIKATIKQLNILEKRKAELTEWGNYFIKDKNGEYKFVGEKIENEGKVYYDPESNRVKEVFRNILNNKNKEEGLNEINDSVFKEASIKIYDIIRLSEQTRDISEQILSLQDPEKFMALVKRMEEGHLKFLMSGILQESFHTLDTSLIRHFAKKWNLKEEDLIKQVQEEVKNGNIDFEFLGDDTTDLMRQEMLFEILMMMNPKFAEEYRNAKEDLFNQLEADKDYNELMKMLNSENINKDIDKFKTLLQTISEKINLFAKNTLNEISDKYREQLKEDLPESVTPENIEYDQIDHIAYKVFKGIELQKHEAELYKDKNVKERVDKIVEIFKKADEEKFTIKEDDPSVITEKEYKEAMEEDDKTGEDIDENDIVYLLNNPNKISAEKLFNIMRKKEKGEKLTDEEELLLSIDDDILLKKINEHRVKYIKGKNIYAVYNILNKYINSKKENKEVVLTNKEEEIVDYLGDQYFKELTKYENEIVSVIEKYDLLQNKKIKNITFTFNERKVLNLLGFDYFKAVINYKNIQREINDVNQEQQNKKEIETEKQSEIERGRQEELKDIADDIISDEEYDKFIDNNEVSDFILQNIASKIIEGKELSDREMAIFTERTSDIEAFIQKLDSIPNIEQSDIEAKKADIERRRKLTTITPDGNPQGFESEGIWYFDYIAPDGYRSQYNGTDKQKVLDKINAKYDAELANLNNQTASQQQQSQIEQSQSVEQQIADIERRRQEDKNNISLRVKLEEALLKDKEELERTGKVDNRASSALAQMIKKAEDKIDKEYDNIILKKFGELEYRKIKLLRDKKTLEDYFAKSPTTDYIELENRKKRLDKYDAELKALKSSEIQEIETEKQSEIERGRQEELDKLPIVNLKSKELLRDDRNDKDRVKQLKNHFVIHKPTGKIYYSYGLALAQYHGSKLILIDENWNRFLLGTTDGSFLSNEFEQITDESKFFIVPKNNDTLNTNVNLRKDLDEINDRHDAKYVDAVNKGEMTKEQAMQALEKAGRKDSSAYAELAALEGTTTIEIETSRVEKLNINIPSKSKENKEKTVEAAKALNSYYGHITSLKLGKFVINQIPSKGNRSEYYESVIIPLGAILHYKIEENTIHHPIISDFDNIKDNGNGTITLRGEIALAENNDLSSIVEIILPKELLNDYLDKKEKAVKEREEYKKLGFKDINEAMRGVDASVSLAKTQLNRLLIKEINAKREAELDALNNQTASEQQGQVEQSQSVEQQTADTGIGQIPNTEYEVKADGVYYQDEKLDNPENKTYRQLIEAHIERRKEDKLYLRDPDRKMKEAELRLAKLREDNAPMEDRVHELAGMQHIKYYKETYYQQEVDEINAKYKAELEALKAHITTQQEQKVQQSAQKEVEETAEKIKQEQQELQKRNRAKASKSLQTIISNIADRTIKNINKLDSEQRKMLLNDYDLKNTFISLLTEKVYEYMDENNINTITELKSNKEHMDNIETLGLGYLDNLLKEYDFINKDDIQDEQDITDKVEDGTSNVDINQTEEVVESVVKSKDNISNEINNILEQKKDKENDRDAFLDVLRKIKNLKC